MADAYVKELKVDSANPWYTATIVLTRKYGIFRPRATDLPDDLREALLNWLGAEEPQEETGNV